MARRLVNGVKRRVKNHQLRKRLADLYRPFIRPGDLCFDVGANEGQYARTFVSLGARVVAIEPQPELCTRFLDPLDVEVEPIAVGASEGSATLTLAREASTIAHIGEKWRKGPFADMTWDRSITVPTTTLDKLIEQHGTPKVCKMDIEGYEAEALKGLSVPIPVISFEYEPSFPEAARTCCARLAVLGSYEANFVVGRSGEFTGEWVLLQDFVESLFALSEVGDVFVRLVDPVSR